MHTNCLCDNYRPFSIFRLLSATTRTAYLPNFIDTANVIDDCYTEVGISYKYYCHLLTAKKSFVA